MSALADRLTCSPGRIAGRIRLELTDEDLDTVDEIAEARNRSYTQGRTTDTNYTSDSGEDVHRMGIKAELAVARLYDEARVDRSVSATGDNGIDTALIIDEEAVSVDVKASKYENAWLLVKRGYDHEEADVFLSAYVDGTSVELVGFAWGDDLLDESNLEESPAPGQSHMNYTMRDGFENLPEPTGERAYDIV
jgi:hypothetical protein